MQSSCASRLHGQALTQTALGVSAGVWRQMKQLRRFGSVWERCSLGGGVGAALVVVAVEEGMAGWLVEARLGTGASFVCVFGEEEEDEDEDEDMALVVVSMGCGGLMRLKSGRLWNLSRSHGSSPDKSV